MIKRFNVTALPDQSVDWQEDSDGNVVLVRDVVKMLLMRLMGICPDQANPELHGYDNGVFDTVRGLLEELGEKAP